MCEELTNELRAWSPYPQTHASSPPPPHMATVADPRSIGPEEPRAVVTNRAANDAIATRNDREGGDLMQRLLRRAARGGGPNQCGLQ